jgi:hypothetical protein
MDHGATTSPWRLGSRDEVRKLRELEETRRRLWKAIVAPTPSVEAQGPARATLQQQYINCSAQLRQRRRQLQRDRQLREMETMEALPNAPTTRAQHWRKLRQLAGQRSATRQRMPIKVRKADG